MYLYINICLSISLCKTSCTECTTVQGLSSTRKTKAHRHIENDPKWLALFLGPPQGGEGNKISGTKCFFFVNDHPAIPHVTNSNVPTGIVCSSEEEVLIWIMDLDIFISQKKDKYFFGYKLCIESIFSQHVCSFVLQE